MGTVVTSNGPIENDLAASVSNENRFISPSASPSGPWISPIRSRVRAGP